MDCAEIRESFLRGALPPNAALDAHLAGCPHCRELFEQDAELGRSLASATLAAPMADDFFAQVEARVARETGPRAWLRSRPSKLRFLVLVLSALLAVAVGAGLNLRPDIAAYPSARLLALLALYSFGVLLAFKKELFVFAPGKAGVDHTLLALGALGLPFVLAFAPATDQVRVAGLAGALGCFSYGALLTLPTALLIWALDRDDRPSVRTVLLSAAALGLSANLLLELHCPNGDLMHVLLGHASLGLAWLLLWALTRRLSPAPGS
jgi:hypothetical protein